MLRIKFENPTGNTIATKIRGVRLEIPPYSVKDKAVSREIDDSKSLRRWLDHLKSSYRAVRVGIQEVECLEDEKPEGEELGDTQSTDGEPEAEELNKKMLSLEAFAAKASIKKGSRGWWTVNLEDVEEPFKVRGCDDEAGATQKAYEEYLEG